MAIEINRLNGPSSQGTETGQVSSASNNTHHSQTASSQDPARVDSVNLTDTGRQLSRLESEIRNVPVVDTKRVDSVRESVNDGTYTVDNRAVAHKLMQFEAYLPNN